MEVSISSRVTAFAMVASAFVVGVGALVLVVMMLRQDRRFRDLVPRLRSVAGITEAGTVEAESRGTKRTFERYFLVRVPFVYEVDGRALRGRDFALNEQPEFARKEDAEAFLQRFPAGTAVTVWYNPDDPRESVLEPRFQVMVQSGFFWGMLVIGVGLTVIGVQATAAWRADMRARPLPVSERRKVLKIAGATAMLGACAGCAALVFDGWDRWSHSRRAPHLRQVAGWLEYVQARSAPDRVEVTYQYALPGEPSRSRPGDRWRFGRQTVDWDEAEAFEKQMDRQTPFAEVWYDARNPADSALQPLHVPYLRDDQRLAILAGSLLFAAGARAALRGQRALPPVALDSAQSPSRR